MVIIERLIRATRRGVKVDVMARPPHTLKRDKLVEGVGGLRIMDDVGIKIHKLKHLKLHGKMLLADGVAAIVGSINFAAGSLDGRRELAIEMRDDRSWIGCTKSPGTTGSIRTRSISRTRDCWPISRTASKVAQRSSQSTSLTRTRGNAPPSPCSGGGPGGEPRPRAAPLAEGRGRSLELKRPP